MRDPVNEQDTQQTVKVLFFGAAADLAGVREIELSRSAATSLESLWVSLTEHYPDLAPMRGTLAFAVNGEYTRGGASISPGDEVAVLPPVSGG